MVAPNKPGKDKAAGTDKTRLQASEETAKELEAMEAELAELKAKHDQYFLGLERFEPIKDRENLKKRINALRTSHIRNTGVKFKAQSLWQKFLSYERMWLRIAREIEEGTYSRDLFKARLRKDKREDKKDAKKKDAVEVNENELSAEGGDLASALAEASAAVDAKAREPKTDPELQAYKPEPKPEPKVEARPATPPEAARPPPPPAAARPPSAPEAARPPPPPPPAAARPSGSFPAMKGPPPPPSEARPATAAAAPPRVTGSFPAVKLPPPPPDAAKPLTATSGVRPPPPPPPGSAARPPPPPSGSAARPPPPPGARPPAPASSSSGAVSDDKMRAIYNAYVAAKKQCKESTDGITYESVSRTINSQAPELMKQHNAKAVDFKVVIKNGKATLKAVPRT